MKPFLFRLFTLAFLLLPGWAAAQGGPVVITAIPDTVCVIKGQSINFNVVDNDLFDPGMPGFINVFWIEPYPCIGLESNGALFFINDSVNCCGDTLHYSYRYEGCQGPISICQSKVTIIVKCPKPDCYFVNMEQFGSPDPDNVRCAKACENANATFFAPYNAAGSYVWNVSGGTFVAGANPATIDVLWGPAGSGTVTLVETVGSVSTTYTACVDILSSPVANFTAPTGACLNAPVNFTNTSIGGSTWFWDFGDGSTSSMYNATHSFSTPGLHTVCLTVSKNNTDEQGLPLCCCMDEICMDILIDPLEGPKIYCPSTLCANDSSTYWTDADCGTLVWTVLDHTGTAIPFTGQGTNTIHVQWGAGPYGTVTLEASDCSGLVCEGPVTATIPIIPAITQISGETTVCTGATVTYTVPKWVSVYYDWEVTGAVTWSGEGTNTIIVQWGSTGLGTISLQYFSNFLSGLPGQDPADCKGGASLSVEIKPKFEIFSPSNRVCVGDMSNLFATSFPSGAYDWEISGTPAPTFTGDGGSIIAVTWDAGPGVFVVTATPIDPTVYCNEVATAYVQVIDLPEPMGITGPLEVCPNSTHPYFVNTDQSGVGFIWSATNGTISGSGNPVSVTWGPSGTYTLSVQQYTLPLPGMPSCTSEVKTITVTEKTLQSFVISGPQSVCVNSVYAYDATPPQPFDDATYLWQISNPILGSIVSGQGTPNIVIQWNNLAASGETLSLTVELCGLTHTEIIPISVAFPTPPLITQNGIFCPGAPFILTASGAPGTYVWSTSETTASITSSTTGTYSVILTEPNGCISTTSFNATAHDNPPSPPDGYFELCTNPCLPTSVNIVAPAGPYTYAWDCFNLTNGTSSPPGITTNVFNHVNTCLVETYLYRTTLTDANGCTSVVQTEVVQTDICGILCSPEMYDFTISGVNRHPDCNIVDFEAMYNNMTLEGWNFGDNQGGGAFDLIAHEYTAAGTYIVTASGVVDNTNPPPDFCAVAASITVNIPMVADFSCVSVCNMVSFTDETSFNLPTDTPTSWQWSFGDAAGGMSNLQNPTYTYVTPGTYTVTLVVENTDGCRDIFEKTITVTGIVMPMILPDPAEICEGESLQFSSSFIGGPAVQWDWSFSDDGATNGASMPQHAFLSAGTHTVFLTVTDAEGCFASTSSLVTVHPLPVDQTITANPGLVECAGTMIMLSVPPGYNYLWSDAAGSTTHELRVSDAGTYSVTITDGNGCETIPDPVTVVFMPRPDSTIAGNPFLCNGGCNILSVPNGPNLTFTWSPNGETVNSISACAPGTYAVTVTDTSTPLMCRSESDPFVVTAASEPVFSILISPDDCAGVPVTLQVDPVDPDVTYNWSNGASGPSTIVSQAGSYYAVGTNNITGCSGASVAIIHPLPDLCLVPAGCYEACNPDTICGPEGYAYQWNKDGVPIPGANDQCLIVDESGTYTLTATNEFGCTLTSDTLMLKLIDCTCYGLSASAAPAAGDSCCWNLSYNNPLGNLYGVNIYSDDADLFFDLSTLDASLTLDLLGVNLIGLSNIVPNTPLPGGALNDFLRVCLSNIQNSPQEIIFDWYGINQQLICSDTVVINALLTLVDTIALCPGETVTLGGVAYTAPDVVELILPGANGACDTAATYHLILSPTHTVTLTCPPDITVNGPGDVTYPDPVVMSTCPNGAPTLTRTDGLPSGDSFPLGETLVCFKAADPENCCSNEDSCCFTITVVEEEDPCDEQTVGCIKYELLDIVKDAAGNQTYRLRVTNNCSNSLIYVAFQVPDGILATSPPNNSIYTAPSGREYDVRNPNFSPLYSIRFKSTEDSIRNGESDIFEYVLPPQVCQGCIYATARLYPKIFYSAHLCCIMPMDMSGNEGTHTHNEAAERLLPAALPFVIYPNPTEGALFADLSVWEDEMVDLRVFNSQGQQVHSLNLHGTAFANEIVLPEGLPSGLYILEVIPASGERQKARFILQR
ncbi:MAG: PKD domain-containing protein [Saprospiraceae bacterium]|nr:PKD domain-containing protein [Saprospiraceae bacterium]